MEANDEQEVAGNGAGRDRRRERILTISVLLLVALLTLSDLLEDHSEGAGVTHLLSEGFIVVLAVLCAAYIWQQSVSKLYRQNRQLGLEMLEAREDAKRWRNEASTLLAGLGEAINTQFDQWLLTSAEKEVAMLMLKGLSHKEISEIRETGERTVRQQAASVYRKAGLEGRAQLSAFFLEDLLLPLPAKEI